MENLNSYVILLIAIIAMALSIGGSYITLKKPDRILGKLSIRVGQAMGIIILFYIILIS